MNKHLIIPRLTDDQFENIISKYNFSNIFKNELGHRNSGRYYVPPELLIEESDYYNIHLHDPNKNNWVSRIIYKILDQYCQLSGQQYFDVVIEHRKYIEDRPICKECGELIRFDGLGCGYGRHPYRYDVESTEHFCSANCTTKYNNRNKILGFSISNKTIFKNMGPANEVCYLYIAHTKSKGKFGVTKDLERRINISNSFDNEPYESAEIVFESTRAKLAEFEDLLKRFNNGEEYFSFDKESYIRDCINRYKDLYKPKHILLFPDHSDDDTLSFGGLMVEETDKGNIIHVRYATIGGVHRLQNFDMRYAETKSVMDALHINDWDFYYKNMDAMMDTVPQREIATKMDKDIDNIRPDEVYTCYPSTHQDHIAFYNAFMITQRLRDGFRPALAALGEYPFILTSHQIPNGGFLYRPMTEELLNRKIELFSMYKSQLKPSPSPLGVEGVKILARTRGIECGCQYAEKYYLLNQVIN